jgi:hypothetical protein
MLPRLFPLLLLGLVAARAADSKAPAPAVELFDHKDLAGWTYVNPSGAPIAKVCHVTPQGVLRVKGKPIGYLVANGTYTNYRLHVEWRWTSRNPRSNGGILVNICSGPIDRKTWPCCLQVQWKVNRAGDYLPMAGYTFAELPTGATQTDRQQPSSEKPMGQWNSADVLCQDGTVVCRINGVLQNRATAVSAASGQIGLQLEGYPYEVRSIRLEPL